MKFAQPSPLTLRLLGASLLLASYGSSAQAQRVRISDLSDVNFGAVSAVGDQRRSQNLCVFLNATGRTYSVTAYGNGAANAFSLSNGHSELAFDVEWAGVANASSGSQLVPAVPLTGQSSSASNQTCSSGPISSASLTIVLRGTQLADALQGTYSGTLTLVVAPD